MAFYKVSDETKAKVDEFLEADDLLKRLISEFEQNHKNEMEYIETVREERNQKLDNASRAVRAEADRAPITVKKVICGPFIAQRRLSQFYIPDRFLAIAEEEGVYNLFVEMGIIKEEVILDKKYEEIKSILEEEGVADLFEECEDERETSSPALTAPKPIQGFGTKSKE